MSKKLSCSENNIKILPYPDRLEDLKKRIY